MEEVRCVGCGRELHSWSVEGLAGRCEDCVPQTGPGSRLVGQFSANLRRLRRRAGLDRAELARRAGMWAADVARYETEGAPEPLTTTALKLAHGLGVEIDELLDRIYWDPGEVAPSPAERRPFSERLAGFFLVLPPGVPAFEEAPPREPVADRHEAAAIFGANLREARQRRRLTQMQLARAAGLSKSGLSLIERGIRETTVDKLFALACALSLPPEYLLRGITWLPKALSCAPPHRGGARQHAAYSLDEKIKTLWHEGRRTGDIATAVGASPGAVSAIVHRLREHGEDMPYRNAPTREVHEGARRRRSQRGRSQPQRSCPARESPVIPRRRDFSREGAAARIGANVASYRERAGLTLRQLAEAAEVDHAPIHRLEQGKFVPRIALLLRLAGSLNVRCGVLVGGITWESRHVCFRIAPAEVNGEAPRRRIGQSARRARRRLGVSQSSLGVKALIDRGDIVDLECGDRDFRIFAAVRLASALGLSLGELFSGAVDWRSRPLPAPISQSGDRQPTIRSL